MAGTLGDIQIIVSTEDLITKSEEVSKYVESMKSRFEDLKETMKKTENYWIGDGGNVHRETYQEHVEEIDEILKRLAEHPRDLITMAAEYSTTENQIQEMIQSLPSDVID